MEQDADMPLFLSATTYFWLVCEIAQLFDPCLWGLKKLAKPQCSPQKLCLTKTPQHYL